MLSKNIDIRVYYEDTDSGGIVYYANYLKFAERCRTEFLRDIGVSQNILQVKSGIKFIVHSISIEYLNPSYLDDLLTVNTSIDSVKKASIKFNQKIFKKKENKKIDIINSTCKVVSVNDKLKVVPIPNLIIKKILEEKWMVFYI